MTEPENVNPESADETVVEPAEVSETPAPAEPEVPAEPLKPLDDLGKMILNNIKEKANEYNALAKRVKAASGDPLAVIDDLRENPPTDETRRYTEAIEKLDEQREQLYTARDALLKPLVAERVEQAKSGLGNAEPEAKEMLKVINAGKKYFGDVYDPRHLEGDGGLPALVSLRAASTGGAPGTDGRSGQRIRGFDVYVDGQHVTAEVNGKTVSNLATAAKALGVETGDLRDRFQAAAGTKDPKAYPKEVNFTFEVGEGEERKSHNIRCVRAEKDSE